MQALALQFPGFDPVAFSIGPVTVRWYGLAYMAGLLLGWLYIRKLLGEARLWSGKPPITLDQAESMLLWTTVGVVVGGRLGFALLYEPGYFLDYPLDLFKVWHGGMAFHGGVIGTGLAIWLFARQIKVSALALLDLIGAAVPIGLFFGRIANFINGELWGNVTSVPWGMVFPEAGPLPRHPSQIYEAALEGIVLFLVLRVATHRWLTLRRPGTTIGIFLLGYGLARIFSEFFREVDPTDALHYGVLTSGILYSIPMVLVGGVLVWRGRSAFVKAT